MSLGKDLDELTQHLQRKLLAQPLSRRAQSDPEHLRRLSEARQRLNPPRGYRALPRIAQGILAFRLQGRQTPYPDLKYACHGIARPTDWEGRLLLDHPPQISDLLVAVSQLVRQHPYAYRACALALLRAWQEDLPPLRTAGRLLAESESQLEQFLHRAGLI